MGAIARTGEESAAQVIVQGGLRAMIASMLSFPGVKSVQYASMRISQYLSKDADNLAVMASENVIQPLRVAKERNTYDTRVSPLSTITTISLTAPSCPLQFHEHLSDLVDVLESGESSRGAQHQEILGIIFAGILRMLLTAIEDARRNKMFVNLPRFAAFMKYLSAGTGKSCSSSHVTNVYAVRVLLLHD